MRKTYIPLAILALGLLASCGGAPASSGPEPNPGDSTSPVATSSSESAAAATYQIISAEEAKRMMDETSGCIVLDVRTQEEYDEGHIDGAVLLPYDEISQRAESELPDKDATILVYCRTGRRSAIAAEELANMGYTNVYDFGGIVDWPYETV